MCSSPKPAISLNPPGLLPLIGGKANQPSHSAISESNANVERLEQQRLKLFQDQEPSYENEISIQNLRYPNHLLQFKQSIKNLNFGQMLKVSSPSSILIEDLAAASRILNLPIQILRYRRLHFLYVSRADN